MAQRSGIELVQIVPNMHKRSQAARVGYMAACTSMPSNWRYFAQPNGIKINLRARSLAKQYKPAGFTLTSGAEWMPSLYRATIGQHTFTSRRTPLFISVSVALVLVHFRLAIKWYCTPEQRTCKLAHSTRPVDEINCLLHSCVRARRCNTNHMHHLMVYVVLGARRLTSLEKRKARARAPVYFMFLYQRCQGAFVKRNGFFRRPPADSQPNTNCIEAAMCAR